MRKTLPGPDSLTRRQFIYYSAAVAGATALTSSVLARPQPAGSRRMKNSILRSSAQAGARG